MAKSIRCAPILVFAIATTSLIKGMASEDLQVLVNDSAVISCFPNKALSVQWHHTPPGKSSSEYLYAGGRFYSPYNTGRFSTYNDSTTNTYTLVITNVTREDAGFYECKDDVLSGVFGSTQLIVLNSSPFCNSNMHPDGFIGPNKCDLQKETMTFSCAVSFAGKISPGLMWRSFNDNQSLINTDCSTQPNHISCSSFTLKADPKYDGSVFICETKASIGARFNCSTEVIKVQYFSADNETSARKVHDNVSCIVRSNLETRYNWTVEQKGQDVFVSSSRTIVMQKPGIYRCDVEYSIRNNTCSFLTSVVNASEATDSNGSQKEQSNVLAIALSIVLIVLIAVIVGFVIYIKVLAPRKKPAIDDPDAEGKVPLNDFRRMRLDKIRPRLTEVCTILQIRTKLIEKLKALPVINEGFDDADAAADENTRFESLLSTISERIDEGFGPFREALAGINPTLAEYTEKGEIVAVDIITKMPDFDGPLSEAFNVAVINHSELFRELTTSAIFLVVAKPSNSIEVLIYCGESENMKEFINIFNSGKLEKLLNDALDILLSNIQSSDVGSLEAKVFIKQREVTTIGQFVHRQDWLQDTSKVRKLPSAPSSSADALSSERERNDSVSKKQPTKSDPNGQLPDTSGEDDIITPPPKKENVTDITESNWNKILQSNYADLLVKIDSNSEGELAGEFRKSGLFTRMQIKNIWGHRSSVERNKAILALFEKGDLKRFMAFRSALWESGQQPVVEKHLSFIKQHLQTPGDRYNAPLKERYRYQLLVNWNELLENINDEDGLISLITERGTLTDYQRTVLRDLSTGTKKLTYLLRLLETGSQQHFDDFCDCLRKNNQGHVVNKYLIPKSINTDLDEIPESFKDVKIHFNIKSKPISGRVLVISNRSYLDQNRSEMHENETNLNIFFEQKLVFQNKPIFDGKLVTSDKAQEMMMKALETEQQNPKDFDVFLMFLFSYGNSREIFTIDGQSFKIDDLFDMFDDAKCPKLKGKPKLFIIQTFERDGHLDSPSLDEEGKLSVSFNLKNDMAVVYATVKGEPKDGREVTGTMFTRCLLKVFFDKIQESDFKEMIDDVLELLRKRDLPSGEVQTVQQLATFKTTLTEKVFLIEQRKSFMNVDNASD